MEEPQDLVPRLEPVESKSRRRFPIALPTWRRKLRGGRPPRPGAFVLRPWLRPWPVYLLTLGVVVGSYFIVRQHRAAGHADPVLPASVQLQQNIEVQFGDVIMEGRQHGVKRWVITSPKVSLSRDGRYTYFEPDPKGKFYNLKDWKEGDGGQPSTKTRSMVWNAKKAQFDSFTEDLMIEGNAVITTDTDDVIKTEAVEYKSRDKQVNMPKPIDLTTKDGTRLKANELHANTDAEVLELKGKVDLVTPVNDQEKI